jgi:hypothetical protein
MPVTVTTISIMPGQSISTALDCSTGTPVRILMPSTWEGGGSDIITFQSSGNNTTYADLLNHRGQEVEATIVPGTMIVLVLDLGLKSGQFLKIRAGSRNRPVVQSAQRDFVIALES